MPNQAEAGTTYMGQKRLCKPLDTLMEVMKRSHSLFFTYISPHFTIQRQRGKVGSDVLRAGATDLQEPLPEDFVSLL